MCSPTFVFCSIRMRRRYFLLVRKKECSAMIRLATLLVFALTLSNYMPVSCIQSRPLSVSAITIFFLVARPQLTVQVNGSCNSFATTTDTRGSTTMIITVTTIGTDIAATLTGTTRRITAATISATTTSTSASAPTAHTAWIRAAPSAHTVEK